MSLAYGLKGGHSGCPNALLITVANDSTLIFSNGRGNPGTVFLIALFIKKYLPFVSRT